MDKPVDSAQVVLDNRGKKANQAASGGGGGSSVLGLVLKSVAVLFVVCNVTALYVLHFVNHPSPTTRFTVSSFSANTGTSASVGDAVSLSSDNKLRNGAGTTAYLDRCILSDTDVTYYEYINVAKLGTSASTYKTNLMSYRRVKAASTESVLTTFTVDPATRTVSISSSFDAAKNVIATNAIRGIATLSDTQALLLVIDTTASPSTTNVMPASITSSGATLDQSKNMVVATGSFANYMTRLNSKSAIVAYYQTYSVTSYLQSVKVATVAADGTVSLSPATDFGAANTGTPASMTNWAYPITINPTEGSFVIPYYTTDSTAANPGLCVTMSTFSATLNIVAAFTTPVCTTMYMPTYFIDGVMLSDKILLLGFFDKAKNKALTLVTLSITATTASFRSSYVFPEVAGGFTFGSRADSTASYGFSPELSMALLSGNRVAVSFLNPTMNGRQSVKVLKYSTESLTFKDVTPVMPVAPSTFTMNVNGGAAATDKSVTQKVLAVGNDSVVAMHMGMRGVAHQHVSLVESFGSPMGLLRHYNGKANADVAVSGKATDVSTKDNAKMAVGQFYYATTAGYVVTPASTTQSGAEYFTASEDAKVLVTADSKVGVAIATDELFVSTTL